MKYLQRSFTLPASDGASDEQWDLAFLSPEEYQEKYRVSDDEYIKRKNGE